MLLRDHEDMRGRLRLYVFESENVLVFMNFFRWNFAANDAAEEAIRVSLCHWIRLAFRNDNISLWSLPEIESAF